MKNQFNLLDEKWLKVMAEDGGGIIKVSLIELFDNAHNYKGLAGDTVTQDFAVLRFLLSVLHTVFTRFTANGDLYDWLDVDLDTFKAKSEVEEDDILDYEKDLYLTWKTLWSEKRFPKIIGEYLEKYHNRFYLIDERYPFFQFLEIGDEDYPYNATDYSINKLNGRILEGDPTKPRLFMSQYKEGLEYSEAARWLIYINGYAPSKSGRPPKGKKNRVTTGVAYLGKLGGIYASGENLFESLMLNFNLSESLELQKPIWEIEPDINNFRGIPDNLAQLFTYPSRQLLLKSNDKGQIIEYRLDLAISNFEYEPNLRIEPFTFWRYSERLDVKKWNVREAFVPKRHDPDKYFWQEMQTFSSIEGEHHNPGIINWLRKLQSDDLVEGLITLNAVAENYIQKDGVVDKQIYDQISENIGLLDRQENGWLTYIAGEIKETEKVIEKTIVLFAKDLDKIRNTQNKGTELRTKRQIFYSIDRHFRNWLISIMPQDEKLERSLEWKSILKKEILEEAEKLIQSAGNRDFLGYYNDKNNLDNIERAYIRFRRNLKKELG